MLRGPLYENGYRPQLSGHETFPLRYGWLKKAYDAVRESEDQADNGEVFSGPDAIARFGVGKNMVSSMRHWAEAAGVLVVDSRANHAETTSLGHRLFDDHGLDPYMEDPTTSWLIHWRLAGRPKKTTWFLGLQPLPGPYLRARGLSRGYRQACQRPQVATGLVRHNQERCGLLRAHVRGAVPRSQVNQEDSLESPLTELGLIKLIGRRGGFRFVRGPKPSLGVGAFCYAVTDFWNERFPNVNTLSLEALTHEPGSPVVCSC